MSKSQRTSFQGTCTLLNELLTLPTTPKVVGNPRDPSNVSYSPHTPNHVKTQVLVTLTTILVTSDAIYRQPSTIESLVDILFEIIMHVNDSHDRLLRQTAAEALRELSTHFCGLLIGRLGFLFRLAREERLHVKLSYVSLFATSLVSSLQCIGEIGQHVTTNVKGTPDLVLSHFLETLRSIGIQSPSTAQIRLLDAHQESELPSFQIPVTTGVGKSFNFEISVPNAIHWSHLMRADLEAAAAFLLEQIPSTTIFESVRLSQLLTCLLQTGYVSKFTLDDINDGFVPGVSNDAKSIITSTELLVRPDRLATILRWLLQTNQPILWSAAQNILSRVPIGIIQPQLSRTNQNNTTSNDADTLATTQLLTQMLRDNVLQLTRQFQPHYIQHSLKMVNAQASISSASSQTRWRPLLLEWISRRPIHCDADHCAYLITTTPTTLLESGERVLSTYSFRDKAGSRDLAVSMASRLSLLYPSAFDSPGVVVAKFASLAYCYASSGHLHRVPRTFMRTLSVFADFPNSFLSSKNLFQIVSHYLLNFPSIFEPIMQYLECVMVEHPMFAEQVWDVISAIEPQNQNLAKRAVLRLCRFLATISPPLLFDYLPLMIKIVKLPYAKVDVLLEALKLNLRVSPRTPAGEWSFGNTVLEVVHLVLLHHNMRDILTPACDVLAFLSFAFGDFEIRDRAHFYLQLLTHVPADKIRAVIEVTAQTLSENLDVDNPFVNTEASKLNSGGFQPITFKSSSSSAAGGAEGPFTAPNILVLERTSAIYNLNSLEAIRAETEEEQKTQEQKTCAGPVLDDYYRQLAQLMWDPSLEQDDFSAQHTDQDSTSKEHEKTENSQKLQIPFLLRFKTPAELQKEGGDWSNLPLSLYSLSLKMTGSLLYANQDTSVSVPYLSSRVKTPEELSAALRGDLNSNMTPNDAHDDEKSPKYGVVSKLLENDGGSSFPYSYSFILDVNVLLPLPTTIKAKATANTQEGAVAEISLDPIHLSLPLLFLPLPRRFTNGFDYKSYLQQLFDEMWTRMGEKMGTNADPKASHPHESSGDEVRMRASSANSLGMSTDGSPHHSEGGHEPESTITYASSVKYVSKQARHVREAVRSHMKPFLIGKESTEAHNGTNLMKALIFLPHRYHLLFTFEVAEEHTVIRIRTDWWRILTHIDRYFDEMLKLK